jgi:hypothetical protein
MITAVEQLFNIWLNREYITPNEWSEAMEMEKNRATEYAEYCMRCDRIGVLPRSFDDWKKSWEETLKSEK